MLKKHLTIFALQTILALLLCPNPIRSGGNELSAAEDFFLQGIFSADTLAPPAPEGFLELEDPVWTPAYSAKELAQAVLKEASWVFSGMIWGFTFEYTPSDKARKVSEVFLLQPRGHIQQSSEGLRVLESTVESGVLSVNLLYYPALHEISECKAWNHAPYKSAQGRAYSPAFPPVIAMQADERVEARITAMTEAIKEAIREYARGITYNKPRIIRGVCGLLAQPQVIITSGQYLAQVKISLQITEIISYGSY